MVEEDARKSVSLTFTERKFEPRYLVCYEILVWATRPYVVCYQIKRKNQAVRIRTNSARICSRRRRSVSRF
jgi:hypothetical protein